MIVVGGTYSEICFEPIWSHIFGSGLRATHLILENNHSIQVEFHTCTDPNTLSHLNYYDQQYPNLSIVPRSLPISPEFQYDHPLKTPTINPRPDIFCDHDIQIQCKGDDILAYGLLEAKLKLTGNRVVYDPQSPVNPKPFSYNGSSADELITVVNHGEASTIVGSTNISDIKAFFFDKENCNALIVKMGPLGARVYENISDSGTQIPVYQTDSVWPIGSGDVFSAYFALNWFTGSDVKESARVASKATAIYCDSKDLLLAPSLASFEYPELEIEDIPSAQVYLAGPFFTFSERWLINEARNALFGSRLKVFSPFHDVGHGKARDVVHKDLKGLDNSEIVFAIIDGLDSGTLFEVGYAVSKNKKVVAFVQKEAEESLKMLEGTDCLIERDFTTAVYKTFWSLASK